jgi:uncharacterized protein with HEPN domain
MYDQEVILNILGQIKTAAQRIERRFTKILSPKDFLASDEGIDRLDAICMMLIAIGESLKQLDKITDSKLLRQYPEVDWKGAKGVRDVFSHHYFDINEEAVYTICDERIPGLIETISRMIIDVEAT